MTRSEIIAYNAGVAGVLDLAKRSADALAPKVISKPTRYNFAIAALDAVAEEGRALLLPVPPADNAPVASRPSGPAPISRGAMAKVAP